MTQLGTVVGKPDATNVSLSGVRVLVVEDEMMVSMWLEDMLSDMGCTLVGPAARIEPALRLVENAGFDVAILDVNLNGDETYPIAAALTARAIPFVFASGYRAGRIREQYRNVPSLQKPFQQQDLERTLASALGRRPAS
jgi:two-component SAPR family response regulator